MQQENFMYQTELVEAEAPADSSRGDLSIYQTRAKRARRARREASLE